MKLSDNKRFSNLLAILLICMGLSGCIGTVVGAVIDTTIEIVKVPFKVGGAVVDVMTSDELTDDRQSPDYDADTNSDADELRADSATL